MRHDHGDLDGAKDDIAASSQLGNITAQTESDKLLRDQPLIRRMATQSEGDVVEVEIFLNERWIPTRGWSSGHLHKMMSDMVYMWVETVFSRAEFFSEAKKRHTLMSTSDRYPDRHNSFHVDI